MNLQIEILKNSDYVFNANERVVLLTDQGVKSIFFKNPFVKAFDSEPNYNGKGMVDIFVNATIPDQQDLKDTLINEIIRSSQIYSNLTGVNTNQSINLIISEITSLGYVIKVFYTNELEQFLNNES